MNAFIFLIPTIMVLIPNVFKFLVGKFETIELALELHIGGIALMMPLAFLKQDMVEIFTYTIVLSTMALILTVACYVNVQLNPRKMRYQKIGLGIGVSFFILGAGLALII